MEKKTLFLLFIMINVLNVVDTFSTLALLTYFPDIIYEYNAVITQLCHISPMLFVLVKITLVLMCTYILYRTGINKKAQIGLIVLNAVYSVLVVWHIYVWILLYKFLI